MSLNARYRFNSAPVSTVLGTGHMGKFVTGRLCGCECAAPPCLLGCLPAGISMSTALDETCPLRRHLHVKGVERGLGFKSPGLHRDYGFSFLPRFHPILPQTWYSKSLGRNVVAIFPIPKAS